MRKIDLKVGIHPRGPRNHLVDVPGGLGVAHRSYRVPDSSICTGFTVIQPGPEINQRYAAAVYALNGAGELTGTHQIREWGFFDTPIVLTNTTSVGRAYEGVSQWMMRRLPKIGGDLSVVIPVVGECDDSVLNDPHQRAWTEEHLFEALDEALQGSSANGGSLEQGDVGGGTGMVTFELKGGIGSSSRRVRVGAVEYTIGVMLQTNFGERGQLMIQGRPLGRLIDYPLPKKHKEGSCLGVLATDAPLSSLGLERLARRMGLGLARAGSHANHGSGEIFLAFSTAREPIQSLRWEREEWNPLLQSAVEATEEAVYHSLLYANPVENARATVAALSLSEAAKLLA